MKIKYVILVSLLYLMFSHACNAYINNGVFGIGVALKNYKGLTLSTTQKSIKDEIIFVCPLNDESIDRCLTLPGEGFSEVRISDDVTDVTGDKTVHELGSNDSSLGGMTFPVGVAILYDKATRPGIKLVRNKSMFEIHLDVDGGDYIVKGCNGSEGVHLYSFGQREHLYYSYGYEVPATCPDEVYR